MQLPLHACVRRVSRTDSVHDQQIGLAVGRAAQSLPHSDAPGHEHWPRRYPQVQPLKAAATARLGSEYGR